jgi:hypothetical protein
LKIHISTESFVISRKGTIHARDIRSGNNILGIDSHGKSVFMKVVGILQIRGLQTLAVINTDSGMLTIGMTQSVWTDKGVSEPINMVESLTDDYSGTKLEGRIESSVYNEVKQEPTKYVSKILAYSMGIISRRVQSQEGRLIIRVPKEMPVATISRFSDAFRRSGITKSSKFKVACGKYWKWLSFDLLPTISSTIGSWELIKKVPDFIKTAETDIVCSYLKGCIDVRTIDNTAIFGFEETDILSFCCILLPLTETRRFLLTPRPIYGPTEFQIDFSRSGYNRVRSVVPSTGKTVAIEFKDHDCAPFVNGFLLRAK